MAMTQAESYEPFWRAHRDNWRPCTPDDVWGLREDRTFAEPSRAHVKRLRRFRPVVTAAETREHDVSGARLHHNGRVQRARPIAALCAEVERINR